MKEIPLTKGFYALVDDEDYEVVSLYRWWVLRIGRLYYAQAHPLDDSGKLMRTRHISMHRLILNAKPGEKGDHRNGNGLDNRRCNLRICSHSENMVNSSKRRGTLSKYKGVTFVKERSKWLARVGVGGQGVFLGYFDREEDAAKAYDKEVVRIWGEFARANFAEDKQSLYKGGGFV